MRDNNKAAELLEKALKEKTAVEGTGEEGEAGAFNAVLTSIVDIYHKISDFFQGEPERQEEIKKLPPQNQMSGEGEPWRSLLRTESYAAYKHLLKAIEKESFDSRLYLNLGLALELNGELDKSFLAYENAQKYSGGDLKINFLSLYNAARIRGQQRQIEEALKLYQGALEIVSDSIEVKTNIELLMMMMVQQKKGKGGGDSENEKEEESDSGNEKRDGPYQSGKEQPRVFESHELSEDDVRKILEEIQSQEQRIRAREQKRAKERPRAKDW